MDNYRLKIIIDDLLLAKKKHLSYEEREIIETIEKTKEKEKIEPKLFNCLQEIVRK